MRLDSTFAGGLSAGIVISIIGVRVLRPLTDVELAQFSFSKEALFNTVDVILTGALLGGGSDGIHKIINVITEFLDTSRERIKSRRPGAGNGRKLTQGNV